MTPLQDVQKRGDEYLRQAGAANIRLPRRLRDHLGSNVSVRRVGWYWLNETAAYLKNRGENTL